MSVGINICKVAMCDPTVSSLGIIYRVKGSFHIWKGGDRKDK